jgi:hypothetical protein
VAEGLVNQLYPWAWLPAELIGHEEMRHRCC